MRNFIDGLIIIIATVSMGIFIQKFNMQVWDFVLFSFMNIAGANAMDRIIKEFFPSLKKERIEK